MKTLASCIIAKNEDKLIRTSLDYIKDFVDQIILVDTGSSDSTVDKANQWKADNPDANLKLITVGNRFHDSDGDFNFGKAKTFAMQSADTDYVLWMDVADILTDSEKARKYFDKLSNVEHDVSFTMPTSISERFDFNRLRIVPKKYGYFIGRIHEYISKPSDLVKHHIPVQFNNQHNGSSLDRNIRLLEKDWEEEPTGRTAFYLGNSYRELNDTENAMKWFRKRIYNFDWLDEFSEEHYKSVECIASLMLPLVKRGKTSPADLWDIADEMIKLDPTRIEGYYYMGEMHMYKQEYKKALEFFNKYKICKIPNRSEIKLWLDNNIYGKKIVGKRIKECEFAMKNSEPLVPESISDFGGRSGQYKVGNSQYN
jgi:glycosyltransferase involved in cell wall biosynthesis